MAKGPQTGDQAPDFELEGTGGTFKLSDHLGERVILLFYPGDNTPVCTKQFCSYRGDDDLSALDATVVGISSQDMQSHDRFSKKYGLTVPLLADSKGEVAKNYGVRAPIVGRTRRAVFIIDEQGIVRHRDLPTLGLDFQTADQLRQALDAIGDHRDMKAPVGGKSD